MAKDNRRGHKDKDDEKIKSKKKIVTQDASPETSSSRRSSRTLSSSKQTKENPSTTRKSKRLEKNKLPDSPPIKVKSKRTQEKTTTTPTKTYGRRKKHTYVGSSGSEQHVEEPASNKKSKTEKVKRSLKVDSKEDKRHEKQGSDVGGRKRKRVTISVNKASSKPQRIRTEPTSTNDNDKESQDKSSQATSSSNRDIDSGSKSVESKGDDVEECSDKTGEESTLKTSETQCSTSNSSLTNFSAEEINGHVEVEESPNVIKVEEEELNDRIVDLEQIPDFSSPSKKDESSENGSETPTSGKSSSSKKETLTKKTDPDVCTNIKEFWVPVQISNVQLEQYCSMLLSNAMALSSCSKSDTVGALHDILVSNRKCCDHPYIVDQSIQAVLNKDLEPVKFLDVGIKASGKLQFLDLILPEMRKRELRVLILFQPLSGTGKDSTSIGDILDDFVRQRFGIDSYERVDAIITTPSKRQAALNNFNNKEKGRFVFLLDYRACLPSIKLSSVDTIIIFDSEWNPANDLRALQKIAIDPHQEQIKIFRLYTSYTLEEKILKLSEHNVTIDKGLQNLSRSTCDALLMWGADYLFKKLTEFHSEDDSNEECSLNELKEEFLKLATEKNYTPKLIIKRVEESKGENENLPLPNELPGGEQPHTFWKNLLVGKDPCWKYLTQSTPRQRKRPNFYEGSPQITNGGNDDVGRKRKKTTPVTEKVISSDESQLSPGESMSCAAMCDETSFRYLLKLNISELCRVLKLSEEVKKMVEKFLEYVMENYQVNKEPANTLQAFLISLCWIGSSLLKQKLDRKQTLTIAKKRLNFSCEEEETNSVYLKLESAKEMFLHHTKNKKKTKASKDPVNVEILDSPEDQYVTISPAMSDVPEDRNDSPGSSNTNSLPAPAPAPQENVPPIQPSVSPTSAQPVPTNSVEIQKELIQDNPQTEKVDELITETPLVEQQREPPPQVVETAADVPDQSATQPWTNLFNLQEFENINRGPTRMPTSSDPLQAELEKFVEYRNTVFNFYEAIKGKLKADYEKEIAEAIAKINRKYEGRSQNADSAFQTKKKEIDMNLNKVVMNKILAEAFRSKCRDLNPFNPSQIQSQIQGEMQHMNQFHGQRLSSSAGQPSGSHQVLRGHPPLQVVHQSANLFSNTPTRSPSTTPSPPPRPPSTAPSPTHVPPSPPPGLPSIAPSPPPRPPSTAPSPPPGLPSVAPSPPPIPPSTAPAPPPRPSSIAPSPPFTATSPPAIAPFTAPSPPPRPPSMAPSLPPGLPSIAPSPPPIPPPSTAPSPSPRPPSIAPLLPPRPPPPPIPPLPANINPTTTPTRPPPNITSIKPPPNITSITTSSTKPPPNIISTTPSLRNPRLTAEIRAPAPHIRPFKPSTSMSTHHPSTSLPPSSATFSPTSAKPPTNHNTHPTQPVAPPPPVSLQLPPLHSLHISEQHPPATSSLPPMPSIPISNTGLYSSSGRPDVMSLSALDLLMDVDKQAGFHGLTSSLENWEADVLGKAGEKGELVCLSDDD